MLEKKLEQGARLFLCHALEILRIDRVDEQRLAAGHRVDTHHRLGDLAVGRGVATHHGYGTAHGRASSGPFGAMRPGGLDGAQGVEQALHGCGQVVVSVVLAGPHGVSAELGQLQRIQQREAGRLFKEREVRMPGTAKAADLALVGLLQHGNDVGVLVQVLDVGHTQDRTKTPRHVQLLRGRELLVAHEQYAVLRQRLLHTLHPVRGRVGKVDAKNFRPTGRGEGLDGQRGSHGQLSKFER